MFRVVPRVPQSTFNSSRTCRTWLSCGIPSNSFLFHSPASPAFNWDEGQKLHHVNGGLRLSAFFSFLELENFSFLMNV